MLNRVLSFVLALSLTSVINTKPVLASSKEKESSQSTQKVKRGIIKLSVGKVAKVTLKLRDNTELAGYVSEVRDESFVVTDAKTGMSTAVAYMNVTQVKGQNLSTKAKVAIWVSVGIGVTLLLWWIKTQVDDCC